MRRYGRAKLRALKGSQVLAAMLILASCRPAGKNAVPAREGAPPLRRLNVVLVTIDTLRADRLGCYGYAKVKTPNLDQLALQGVVFENAIAQTPLTAPSHASIFTGLYPTVHQVRDTGGFLLRSSHSTLAEILRRHGWDTAAFVGASVLKQRFGFDQGFAVYDDQMPKPGAGGVAGEYPERRAADVVDRAIEWIAGRPGGPFFLWAHVFDPHSPYSPPSPFREMYREAPYDGEVAYTDQQLGRLFQAVAERFPPQETLLAVLSDHGESLSEHGEYTHGVFLYDSTLRVPFLLAGPGIPAGVRVRRQARTIDVLPTLLELVGIRQPAGVQGASLVPSFTGKEVPTGSSYLETLFPRINMGWAELRGMRTDRWKYIHAPTPELYDLVRDPAETTNVIAAQPVVARDLERRLKAVIAGEQKRTPETIETTALDERTLAQLKSLGYLGGSARRQYALTGAGIDPKERTEVLKLLYFGVSPDVTVPLLRRIAMLRQALREDAANPTVYYHLGEMYRLAGRHSEAMKLYQDGIRNGVRAAWLYSRLGYLYLRQGRKGEAIASYETAAQLNPSDCESLNDLATAYLETGRVADAERTYKWCLETNPEYSPAHNGLGLVAVQKRDLSAARTYFERALRLDPDLLEAQLNLGRIYRMMGASSRARACFEAFLARAHRSEYGRIIPQVREELAAMQ